MSNKQSSFNTPQQPKELPISSSVIPPARPISSNDKGQASTTKKIKLQEDYARTSNLIITGYQSEQEE
ncbi:hypothetical protein RCL_jg2954.t1 [Rhizophagus clarus]|uniref:Uncharacterized protein n=1 Tax=Rhizophagus clarus TaxID=94130 RepID=A0A8H3R243_9GLOM|nr:hypothetical protein RCL_jg2954.t1 [Rhizophagus clarus]